MDSAPVLRDEDVAVLCESSGLTEEDVREQFNAFITEHPNGKMKKKDFGEMMKKALPQRDDADKMEKHMFRVYDANDDGYVDFVEFMMIFYIMSDGSPEEVLAKIFRVFDVNSDGTISEKELKRLIKDMFMMIKEENPEEASKEFITSSTFAEMDEDQNGKKTLKRLQKNSSPRAPSLRWTRIKMERGPLKNLLQRFLHVNNSARCSPSRSLTSLLRMNKLL